MEKKGPNGNLNGADVQRRPSKRQQEKAPEGRSPHMNHDEDEHHDEHRATEGEKSGDGPGQAPVDSKFTEEA
jgi:hypothetical protein